jgi:hypothetical protein
MDEFFEKLIRKDQRGIEIGPSFNPLVPKKAGWNVVIVDYASREELKEIYSYAKVPLENIEEVDVIWRGGRLYDAVSARYPNQKFDYIIASHVIEHLPNLVAFFQDLEKLTNDDGVGLLVVPDKRYTFDYLKPISTTADVGESYIRNHAVHPLATAFKHYFLGVYNGNRSVWAKNEMVNFGDLNFIMPIRQAYEALKGYMENEYVDYHRWIFTQNSFVLIIKELLHLGLINIDITEIYSDPTRCDFYVCLSKNCQKPNEDTWAENRLYYYKNIEQDLLQQLIHSGATREMDSNTNMIRENAALKTELQRIYISRSWRLVKFLKKIRLRLIPDNTLMHRLFVRLIK